MIVENIVKKIGSMKKDLILLSILLLFFFSFNIAITTSMKQLPSPIYGGDYYYQMGCINHIRYGGEIFDNCNLLSENPGYFPLYGMIVASFANLFNLTTFNSMITFSNVVLFFSVLFSYSLFKNIFNNSYVASLGVLSFITTTTPILKYTPFAKFVMVPLFLLTLFFFYKKQNYLSAISVGIVGGLSTITHSILFPITYGVLFFLFIYLLLSKSLKVNKHKIFNNLKILFPLFIIIFLFMVPISLLYWYSPIFKSGAQTSAHYLEWNGPGDMSKSSLQLKILLNVIKNIFFNFSSLTSIFISLFSIVGLFFIFTLRKMRDNLKFLFFILIITQVFVFSYFVTIPLLGIHFVPNYMFDIFGKITAISFSLFGLLGTLSLLSNWRGFKKYEIYFMIILILLLGFSHILMGVDYIKNDRWYTVSQNTLNPIQIELQDYILKNTDVNDVFLTTKEVGFMLNALTGRKLLSSRRAQNDAFENMDEREMAQAVILYGNDTFVKKELIKKYGIKYFYWDYYWIRSEYYFDDQNRVTGWFDPLIAFENEGYKKLLKKNNISFFVEYTYVDPSLKSRYHPKFNLIFISPINYYSAAHPWGLDLDPYLEEVWSYKQGSQKISRLFKINISISATS